MMQKMFIRLVVAIALATGGWLSWSEATLAARRADATEHIVTLRLAEIDRELDSHATAIAAYWLGRYDEAIPDTDDRAVDAAVLLTAANAAFRQSERQRATGPAAVQQLDGVLNAYASALKASPRNIEAAYNYEFVARYRDQVARSQGKGLKMPTAPATAMAGDLPAGATIHGQPGAPPPEAKMEELQMLAPMEYGDREAQPEATPGGKRERKG
jgi:hypothetical protein